MIFVLDTNVLSEGQKAKPSAAVSPSLIAATAPSRGWTVATRNVEDFRQFGVQVFNRWTDKLQNNLPSGDCLRSPTPSFPRLAFISAD